MTLLSELIPIPEQVHQSDFVLRLSHGLADAERTLDDYVVTEQLVHCFDEALGFIQNALAAAVSKAIYLNGSFGSGKSHFMAVLNLLLAGNPHARSIVELAPVVARHNAWTEGRRFLLVPYHMIGATDLESAILGGYAEQVRRLHPESPVPGFYVAEHLFHDAETMRERMGDTAFFAALNEAAGGGGSGWGGLAGGWDAATYGTAKLEPPAADERVRLVGDLISAFFSAYRTAAGVQGESFLPLDQGLSVLCKHARDLGYDAVILFLDELILWLASRAADTAFVSSEGAKLSKLVEAQYADRPIPLVSFVARQRDLRELVGENLAGALLLQFADTLKYWEARFEKIRLEDRNLPVIAERRLLRPRDEQAREQIDTAFAALRDLRADVSATLLTGDGQWHAFRQVYPFSPALVQTLVAVSSVLQRERTALKLMQQLLVDRRNDLELGQLIPVGDLFDVIAEGDEPFSDAMRLHFNNAKTLYYQKLLPMLERRHGITWQDVRAHLADPQAAQRLTNDARLLKTLLLAALVPEVESLRALTAARLAALNHGTIKAPIPGREAQIVMSRCREWAAEVGEIKVSEDFNPLLSIQVTGIDLAPILENAASYDNQGNRRRKVREMLFAELGIPEGNDLFSTYSFAWRGTRRAVDVIFDNVREVDDGRLRGREGAWTLVLDFPFDDPGYTARDDIARLQRFAGTAQTLLWLPNFLSQKALKELGILVRIDAILTGDRFGELAGHLSQVDQAQAKALLKNQQSQLQQRMRQCLEATYGISNEPRDAVETVLAAGEHIRSLEPTFSARMPVGANVGEAFKGLLDQLLAHQYPAHPRFETDIRPAVLHKVHGVIQQAVQAPDQRVYVADRSLRALVKSIADPLKVGQTGDTHFVLGSHWRTHFHQKQAMEGIGQTPAEGTAAAGLTVSLLRAWIDQPDPMGLPIELQNLVILTYADQGDYGFFQGSAPIKAGIERIQDECALRQQTLPTPEHWTKAVGRMASLFGRVQAQGLNAANLTRLIDDLSALIVPLRIPLRALAAELGRRLTALGVKDGQAPRLITANAALALAERVLAAGGSDRAAALAEAEVLTSEAAMAAILAKAQTLEESIRTADWPLFEAVWKLDDPRRNEAARIRERVIEVLSADEHAIALKPALDEQRGKALRLLSEVPPPPPPPPQPPPPPPRRPGLRVILEERAAGLDAVAADAVLGRVRQTMTEHPDARLDIEWRILTDGED
ncbi:MAG: phage resistance protein [Thiocapsa sp.]|uniref:phage resistance protein n=1 Tax=Thiocapsa sp. TaxID=2024551 RepID=UPI001BCB941F|nr:phage resistance protein [Thiocapsa sp.]QVL47101.1 MAG: phage resistance protein [Thiocapsa sp.]